MNPIKHDKLSFAPTYRHWFEQNFTSFEKFLYEWIDEYSRDAVREEFNQDPYLGYCVLYDWMTNHKDPGYNVQRLLNYIRKPEVFVILLLGMPGSGKTTTAYKICELLKEEYNIVQISPLMDAGSLPDWIRWKSNVYKLESRDLAIIDETAIQNPARRAMSKKNVDDLGWLAVGRHVGAKMIYITQLSSVADINITRWANIVISKGYSTSAAGASNIERKHIADNPVLRYLKPRKNYARIESEEKDWSVVSMRGSDFMVHLKPPAFMNDKLSRPYQRYIERAEGDQKAAEKLAMQDAEVMKREEIPAAVIYQQMMIRGFYKSLAFWQDFTGESKKKGYDDYS